MTLRKLKEILQEYGIESAQFEAEQLICHYNECSHASAMTGDFEEKPLIDAAERRKLGEPLQYILGEWEFMGYTFKVSPDCLIPRPDTELLTQFLIDNLPKQGRFADLCTGSGCIAISALRECPSSTGIAVEKYKTTLALAKENAKYNNVSDRLQFIHADVCEDCLQGMFDIIVSNPPYVTPEEMKNLQKEVTFEPKHALTDGIDGLSIIRKIIEIYPSHIKDGGFLAIEFGWKQSESIKQIAEEYNLDCNILKDIENRDRVAIITIKKD